MVAIGKGDRIMEKKLLTGIIGLVIESEIISIGDIHSIIQDFGYSYIEVKEAMMFLMDIGVLNCDMEYLMVSMSKKHYKKFQPMINRARKCMNSEWN